MAFPGDTHIAHYVPIDKVSNEGVLLQLGVLWGIRRPTLHL